MWPKRSWRLRCESCEAGAYDRKAMDFWSAHRCVPPGGRLVYVRGRQFRHCRCEDCGRDFVEDVDSGEQFAVNASTFDFDRLADEVSDRWLSAPCPKIRVDCDAQDRLKVKG
jgi:hypothetical protein